MMPSLYSGVSGLKNHGVRMNIIGNNIANVNTYGFKYSRVTFQDILSQTLAGAAAPTEDKGGVNPKQMGLGMSVASIDKIFTEGSLQNTGKNTDLAITGDGFFIMKKGTQEFYTRAGTFNVDREGYLVNPANGLKVQGWLAQTTAEGTQKIDTSASLEDVIIPIYGKTPARETGNMNFRSNLNSVSPIVTPGMTPEQIASVGVTTSIDVYDSEGEVHAARFVFWRTPGINTWTASAAVTGVDGPVTLDVVPGAAAAPAGANEQVNLTFDNMGSIVSVGDNSGGAPINTGDMLVNLRFTIRGAVQIITLNLGTVGLYNGITQFAAESSTKAVTQDGYPMGYLENFIIDDRGIVNGSYSNGQKKALSQVALAVFINPGGLDKAGENLYEVSSNSGMPNTGPSDSAGRGKIRAGTLEMSNVDLAEQFTDMIVAQRGFQANSRTITTSYQMIQELLGLKR